MTRSPLRSPRARVSPRAKRTAHPPGAAALVCGLVLSLAVRTALPAGAGAGTPPGDPQHGRAIYESRCQACHSLDRSRIGPAHRGVFGRRAGSVPDYDYSPALRRARLAWTPRTLDRWLRDPEALVPGQKMGYSVPDPKDRRDLIAFLASPDAR